MIYDILGLEDYQVKNKINVKRYFQVLGICLAVLLVGLLGALGFGFWQPTETGLTSDEIATVETSGGKINVLLMGVDEGGLRTDCIMLASFNTEDKKAKLLSIPRDTRMYVGSKYQKVNAAHAIKSSSGGIMGAQGTVEAVTRLTGVPINYYVEMSFNDVAECINLLGPVEFEIPDLYNDGVGMVYDDPVQGLHINLKPGVQEIDGAKAVQLLRYRKGNKINGKRKGYTNGDIDRIKVQQEFLQAVIDQKLNASLILKIPAMFKQLSESIKTNMTIKEVIQYSKYLSDFKSENLAAFSLPGVSQTIDGASYWVCDLDKTRNLIETEFGYDASNITIDKVAGQNKDKSSKQQAASQKPAATASTQKQTAKPSSGKNKTSSATKAPSSAVQTVTEKPKTSNKSSDTKTDATKAPQKQEATKKPAATEKPAATKAPQKQESTSKGEKIPVKSGSGDGEDSE